MDDGIRDLSKIKDIAIIINQLTYEKIDKTYTIEEFFQGLLFYTALSIKGTSTAKNMNFEQWLQKSLDQIHAYAVGFEKIEENMKNG